jgi:hypothetical protein
MSKVKYSEIEKKRPGRRHVWGVLQMEGRKQKFQTVGEGEGARRKAKKPAQRLNQMEAVEVSHEDRFLSWHRSGEPLLLDRATVITLELRSTPSLSPRQSGTDNSLSALLPASATSTCGIFRKTTSACWFGPNA